MIKFARGSSDPRRHLIFARMPHGIPTIFHLAFRDYKNEQRKSISAFDSSRFRFRSIFVIEKSNHFFNLGRTFSISVDRWRKKFRITCREYVLKNSGGGRASNGNRSGCFLWDDFRTRGGGVNRTRREFRRSNIKYEIAKIALPSISLCTVSRKLKLNFYWNSK